MRPVTLGRLARAASVVLAAVVMALGLATPSQAAEPIPGFLSVCSYDHSLRDDPLLFRNRPGASALNDFFGNESTNASSTYRSLRSAGTNCQLSADTAAYWAPSLYSGNSKQQPLRLHAYYRWGNIKDLKSIRNMPRNLRMIAGNANATGPQSTSVVGWTCGVQGEPLKDRPGSCPTRIVLHILFPNCWDGVHLDSANHKSHMAYSQGGRCPSTHPVPIPRLSQEIAYPAVDPSTITLSTGSYVTAHAGFINSWHQPTLRLLTQRCVRRGVQCGPQS